MAPAPNQSNTDAHWKKTTRLMLIHLGVWFFFGYIIHMFVKPLNAIVIPVLGFPLGFYMAAQGSLIVFVVMLFMFAKQQNQDRPRVRHGRRRRVREERIMATQTTSGTDAFYKQLGRMYGLYTGGFVGFVVFLAILEKIGVPNKILGYFFVFFTLAVYAIIGVATRTAQLSEYYVAGRRVPAFYNGMATGADWMSAASFVGMAGTLFLLGYDGLAWVLGWTGGFVLVSILVGPYLRKFGAYTVPDFLSFRYGGNFARFLGVIVLVCCSFTYVTAQIYGTGLIASRFLGMQFEIAVFAGLVGILLCAMLGGMRAVTWTQIAQYIVLIVAYLTPIVILSTQRYGIPLPQLTYGAAIAGDHGPRAAIGEGRTRGAVHAAGLSAGNVAAAHPAVHELHAVELLRHHLLHDGWHGIAAAHPDALFHHAVGEASAGFSCVVAAVHLPAVLLGACLRRVFQAGGVHQHHRQRPIPNPALAVPVGRAWADPDLRQERRESRCGSRRV